MFSVALRRAIAAPLATARFSSNRGVLYMGPGIHFTGNYSRIGKVEVHKIPYPKLELDLPNGKSRKCQHGVGSVPQG